MARVEVPMPQLGESIAEGTVSTWIRKVGETVGRDEPILEISTDKVDAEIPSPVAGVLVEVVVQEGETVEVGTVIAYIETDAAAAGAAAPADDSGGEGAATTEAGPAGGRALPRAGTPEEEPATPVADVAGDKAQRDSASARRGGAPARTAGGAGKGADRPPAPDSAEERLRTRSTPLVRRIAAEHGVEVSAVQGTGRAGRVTKEDVLRHVAEGGAGGGVSWDAFHREVVHPSAEVRAGDRVEPMSRMTKLIAEHMVLSRRIAPHVHSYFEIDYSRIDQVRAASRSTWEAQGVKVTYTSFIARAVAQALREFPKLNASVSGESVVYRGEVNLGVAVALEQGLIVPVVRKADELSLVGLARRIIDLAERARAKKLSPEEVQGGTFTLTNPGIFGTVIGFPILNQPQVAIMAVGGIEKRPAVVTDEYGHDAIVARRRGFLSLGFDHRLVNGADADQFLARVKALLESASAD